MRGWQYCVAVCSCKRVFGQVALGTDVVQLGLGFGQLALGAGKVVALLGQPQRHMAQPGANIQDAQRALGQRFFEVGLKHREANGPFGAAIDFFGEAGRQLIEVTVTHLLKRPSRR